MASPAADPRVDDTRSHGHAGRSAANESTPLLARQDEESRSSQPALWEKIKAWRRDRAVLAALLLLVAVALVVTIVVLAGKPQPYPLFLFQIASRCLPITMLFHPYHLHLPRYCSHSAALV